MTEPEREPHHPCKNCVFHDDDYITTSFDIIIKLDICSKWLYAKITIARCDFYIESVKAPMHTRIINGSR